MGNRADVSYTANIRIVLAATLDRKLRGAYCGRETVNGLKMAIEYLDSLDVEQLTEHQLKHVMRLTTYRGNQTDYRVLTTSKT